ncbi:MAG: CRISPR-associated endonuclease Cas2 [Schleiferilactobacillus harbinensis]|nr:CRISPR-associated endonuclease Cas2 [Schleiferilactobacillus harbinensis]MCI1912281.1 CRISPR-associated endonuclease Cas2 [Schleiferilactobacillus harbinensis]
MLVVVAYDVSVTDPGGTRRLSRVAKVCERYGKRVQNSVFECIVDSVGLKQMQSALKEIVNLKMDSLRFYNLGKNYRTKVVHWGAKDVQNVQDPWII